MSDDLESGCERHQRRIAELQRQLAVADEYAVGLRLRGDKAESHLAALRQEREVDVERLHNYKLEMAKLVEQLDALRLRWTSERPTTEGAYWWRTEGESGWSPPCIVQVYMMVWNEADPDKEARPWCNWGWIAQLDGEWAGPIPLAQA